MTAAIHYVYILKSLSVNRYYLGETQDAVVRLQLHNDESRGTYTSKNGPWVLKRLIEVKSRSDGRRVERYIKKRKSKSYIIKLIEEDAAVASLLVRVLSNSVG